MIPITGAAAASIQIESALYGSAPAPDASFVERYRRFVMSRGVEPVRIVDPVLYGSTPIAPAWVQSTKKSLRESITLNADQLATDLRWISADTASAALSFFDRTADLLPGEPTMYRSHAGDLVAEFTAERGTLTAIVSTSFVVLFSVVNGEPVERYVDEMAILRNEVAEVTSRLSGPVHGGLEAQQ